MRTVSLLPAATEIMAFLGATDHLVGVTHECDYPEIVGSRARVTKSSIPLTSDPAVIDAAVRELHARLHADLYANLAKVRGRPPRPSSAARTHARTHATQPSAP